MGTTAEKLTYLNETKTQLKNMLNLGGASLTTEPFRQYVDTLKNRYLYFMNNGTQQVWDNWDKVNGTGETLTLNNTEEAPMSLVYKGNTLQNGTPTPETPQDIHVVSGDNSIVVVGKNLFTIKNYSKSGYNVKIDNPLKGQSAGTYTISCENLIPIEDGRGCAVLFANENNQRVGNYFVGFDFENNLYSNTKNLTQEELDAPYMRLDFNNNNATQEGINRAKIMINKGNKTTYEPYQGTSYPITLPDGMLLGWIPNTNYYDKIDKSSGKNLFNQSISDTNCNIVNGMIVPNTTSTDFYIKGTAVYSEANKFLTLESGNYYIKTTNSNIRITMYGDNTNLDTVSNQPVTLSSTTNFGGIRVRSLNSTSLQNIPFGIIISKTNSEYEPYGTGWYVKKEIGKVVLNGSENWDNFFENNLFNIASFLDNKPFIVGYGLSNYYKYNPIQSGINTGTVNGEFVLQKSGNYYNLFIKNTDYSTPADFKTWLSTHNTTLYYPLATPTYTLIEDSTLISQLETIKKSYEGQT